jgi:hypothetical protein
VSEAAFGDMFAANLGKVVAVCASEHRQFEQNAGGRAEL